ncbi:signal recognition particle 9 kDa protein [Senna tora]|uniref:Signal recognition particle 9 kDa protein n=1 Tax=Senna tora TaxID=362788 RepID=A0A834TBB9_9FABA|nr:signal recognition particle 9 kDa protein [Senna tora]
MRETTSCRSDREVEGGSKGERECVPDACYGSGGHQDWKEAYSTFNNNITRYVMKYRHCDGKLVLKVSDNRECLKYKTDQAQEAKKMEKLNNIFFTLMARGPEVDLSEVTGKEQMEAQPIKKGRGRKQ